MFKLHGSDKAFTYKTENCYSATCNEVFFSCDPPHVLKTMRNCFSRGKLWVCDNGALRTNILVYIVQWASSGLEFNHNIVQKASSGLEFNHRIVQKEFWCIICHSRCLFFANVEEGTCVPYQFLQNVSGSCSTSKLSIHVIIKVFFTIIDRF